MSSRLMTLKHPYGTQVARVLESMRELEFVNKAAHWDYQRDRIYVRTSKA